MDKNLILYKLQKYQNKLENGTGDKTLYGAKVQYYQKYLLEGGKNKYPVDCEFFDKDKKTMMKDKSIYRDLYTKKEGLLALLRKHTRGLERFSNLSHIRGILQKATSSLEDYTIYRKYTTAVELTPNQNHRYIKCYLDLGTDSKGFTVRDTKLYTSKVSGNKKIIAKIIIDLIKFERNLPQIYTRLHDILSTCIDELEQSYGTATEPAAVHVNHGSRN